MTEIETHQEMTRAEVANYLREFADQLGAAAHAAESHDVTDDATARSNEPSPRRNRAGSQESAADSRVTFMVGADSATIDPPESVTFEIEVDSDSSLVSSGREQSVEFDLSWTADEERDEDGTEDLEIK